MYGLAFVDCFLGAGAGANSAAQTLIGVDGELIAVFSDCGYRARAGAFTAAYT